MSTDNIDQNVMRDRALFYLDRRIREVEIQVPTQEGMAAAGLSYEQRRRALDNADRAESEAQIELGALRWARERILNG